MDEPTLIEFRPEDTSVVVRRMAELVRDRNGWINFQPGIEADDEPPPQSALGGLVSGRGPAVPLATWTPGERRRRGVERTSIGLQHGAGIKAVHRLREAGTPVPEDWHVLTDHPRRGLVVGVPDGADNERVLDWLLEAGEALATIPLTGMWRASIYVT